MLFILISKVFVEEEQIYSSTVKLKTYHLLCHYFALIAILNLYNSFTVTVITLLV